MSPEQMALMAVVVVVFAAVVWTSLVLTTPGQTLTPAGRVAEYTALAQYSLRGRRGSPGTLVETTGMRERILDPLARSIMALVGSTAPDRVRRATAAQLVMAGSTMSPSRFLAIRAVVMFGLPLMAALYVLSARNVTTVHWLALGIAVIWGRRLPSFWLRRRIRARQKAIDRALPYALDLMVACLEGGLSLDASLVKVAEQSAGPLSIEIRKTLQEMSLGRPPTEALRMLGERTGAPDLKRLVENIIQAEQMGVSIAEALRTLAAESRVRRRQKAEEMARKAPIKMVPVLIFFILPALVAVIMTPAVVLFMDTIKKAGG